MWSPAPYRPSSGAGTITSPWTSPRAEQDAGPGDTIVMRSESSDGSQQYGPYHLADVSGVSTRFKGRGSRVAADN